MYPAVFEYLKPSSISEAIALLQQHGEDAKLLAGGQSLVPMMKLRIARPKFLIDIHRISDLNYIREETGQIRCGAMTRHVQIEESELIRNKIPMLCEAAGAIGDAQVRNRGTLGGGLVEADPSGDYGAVVLALNAQMKCISPRGERVIPAADFFTFAYTTALQAMKSSPRLSFLFRTAPVRESILNSSAWQVILRSPAPPCRWLSTGMEPVTTIGVGVTGAEQFRRRPSQSKIFFKAKTSPRN